MAQREIPLFSGGRPRMPFGPRLAAGLLLALITVGVYAGSLGNGFTRFDDQDYVIENQHVRTGLTVSNALWALTSTEGANWHPLTWLSHQLDVQVFGMDARGHHLTSLLLHLFSVLLLFRVLEGLTGSLWRGALVAALFGVHPLHVESVAWTAERKDVLSGLFFMLVLLSWLRYLRQPGSGRYLVVAATFALGLMAKQMLVTLPVLLLLLDFWPLGRLPRRSFPRPAPPGSPEGRARPPSRHLSCLVEKLPLLVLAVSAGVLTLLAQRGALVDFAVVPHDRRWANAAVSAAEYLFKTAWPLRLAAFYPYDERQMPPLLVAGAALFLTAVTAAALASLRRRPWALVGWLWYLVSLAPVIGIVQVGRQRLADRYTYLPLIGVFIVLAWLLREVAGARPALSRHVVTVSLAALLALLPATWRQAGYWKDNLTLFRHAAAVTERNWFAYGHLGSYLTDMGQPAEAQKWFALASQTDFAYRFLVLMRTGDVMASRGNYPAALDLYRRALAIYPSDREARRKVAEAEGATGRGAAARAFPPVDSPSGNGTRKAWGSSDIEKNQSAVAP